MTVDITNIHCEEVTYNIELSKDGVWLDRSFTFSSGDHIEFRVKLDPTAETTMGEMHRDSVSKAAQLLNLLLQPESAR